MSKAHGELVGQWETLPDHFPNVLTPEYQTILRRGFVEGYEQPCRDYGLPVRTFDLRIIDGRPYLRPVAIVGGSRPAPNLPVPIARVLFRLVPAMRRAAQRAERALTERRWLGETDRWYNTLRPAALERNRMLQRVELDGLDDAALAAHLLDAYDNVIAGYILHFQLHGADLLPAGAWMVRCRQWGIEPVEVFPFLVGHSPATRLVGVEPADLQWRSTGYDLDAPTCGEVGIEVPNEPLPQPAIVEPDAGIRDRVPSECHAEFDQWLHDARVTYGVRDDNGAIIGAWPIGLLRRAMLAVGARIGLQEDHHAVELTVDELVGRLRGAASPDSTEVAARAERRRSHSAVPATRLLGTPEPVPPVAALPPAMALFTEAFLLFRELNATAEQSAPGHGTGIGAAPVTGRAVVAHDAHDALIRLDPGDILVTPMTSPAYNSVLTFAGGLVVVEAGLVSHAAVIARELGLPTLLGVTDAMSIPDGSTVTVDPVAGRVTVHEPGA